MFVLLAPRLRNLQRRRGGIGYPYGDCASVGGTDVCVTAGCTRTRNICAWVVKGNIYVQETWVGVRELVTIIANSAMEVIYRGWGITVEVLESNVMAVDVRGLMRRYRWGRTIVVCNIAE